MTGPDEGDTPNEDGDLLGAFAACKLSHTHLHLCTRCRFHEPFKLADSPQATSLSIYRSDNHSPQAGKDQNASPKPDQILDTAVSVLQAYHKESFANFCTGMSVSPVPGPSYADVDGSYVKTYVFGQIGESGRMVQLRLVETSATASKDQMRTGYDMHSRKIHCTNREANSRNSAKKIVLRQHASWIDLWTWLLGLPHSSMSVEERASEWTGDIGHAKLWEWWQITGKHFELMTLPGELRDLLYEYCGGTDLFLTWSRSSQNSPLSHWGDSLKSGQD